MKMGDVTLARTSVRYGSRELLDLPRSSHFSLSLSLSLSLSSELSLSPAFVLMKSKFLVAATVAVLSRHEERKLKKK